MWGGALRGLMELQARQAEQQYRSAMARQSALMWVSGQSGLGQASNAAQSYIDLREQTAVGANPKKKGKMPLRIELHAETDEWLRDLRR